MSPLSLNFEFTSQTRSITDTSNHLFSARIREIGGNRAYYLHHDVIMSSLLAALIFIIDEFEMPWRSDEGNGGSENVI